MKNSKIVCKNIIISVFIFFMFFSPVQGEEFGPTECYIRVSKVGQGGVSITPPGKWIGDKYYYDCSSGSQLTLKAIPKPGWMFKAWGGDLSGSSNPVTLTMNVNGKHIICTFIEKDPHNHLSCVHHCGAQSPGGCWCDSQCLTYNDCCEDKAEVCGW